MPRRLHEFISIFPHYMVLQMACKLKWSETLWWSILICLQMHFHLRNFEDPHQAVVRQLSGSSQAVVRQLSGSHQAVVRQSSGSRQAVVRQSSGRYQIVIKSLIVQPMGLKAFSVSFIHTTIANIYVFNELLMTGLLTPQKKIATHFFPCHQNI